MFSESSKKKMMTTGLCPGDTTGTCEVADVHLNESLDVLIDNYLMLGDDSFGTMLLQDTIES